VPHVGQAVLLGVLTVVRNESWLSWMWVE